MKQLDQAIIEKINNHEKEAALRLCMDMYQLNEKKAKRKLNKYLVAKSKAETGYVYKKPKLRIKKGERLKTFVAVLFCFIGLLLLLVIAYFIKHI